MFNNSKINKFKSSMMEIFDPELSMKPSPVNHFLSKEVGNDLNKGDTVVFGDNDKYLISSKKLSYANPNNIYVTYYVIRL